MSIETSREDGRGSREVEDVVEVKVEGCWIGSSCFLVLLAVGFSQPR